MNRYAIVCLDSLVSFSAPSDTDAMVQATLELSESEYPLYLALLDSDGDGRGKKIADCLKVTVKSTIHGSLCSMTEREIFVFTPTPVEGINQEREIRHQLERLGVHPWRINFRHTFSVLAELTKV